MMSLNNKNNDSMLFLPAVPANLKFKLDGFVRVLQPWHGET